MYVVVCIKCSKVDPRNNFLLSFTKNKSLKCLYIALKESKYFENYTMYKNVLSKTFDIYLK